MAIPESARKVIESGRLAHVVTINRDGSPQVTIVWAGTDGDEIVMAHFRNHLKLKNIRRDPRVSLSIETDNVNAMGLTEYLVVHGTARIEEGGAAELLQKLAYIYIGPDAGKFPPGDTPMPPGYITRITPQRFSGVGPWVG
jgi:PPOX class probable F420-dependent enzyme